MDKTLGTEEGDTCNRAGCTGKIAYEASENCSCHIAAPCASCEDIKLHCPECGWTEGGED